MKPSDAGKQDSPRVLVSSDTEHREVVSREENLSSSDDEVGGLLGNLFGDPDNSHGGDGKPYSYEWPEASVAVRSAASLERRITLTLPDNDWDLMSHFVWESSIKLADLIATGVVVCEGKTVLELGAGAGLPGIVASRCGASKVTITDYPSETIIDALTANVEKNILSDNSGNASGGNKKDDVVPESKAGETDVISQSEPYVFIRGHAWGTDVTPLLATLGTSNTSNISDDGTGFQVILAADTLWLHDQHDNLLQTCAKCLLGGGAGTAYFTYQHHNEHAPSFFQKAEKEYGFIVAHVGKYAWGGRSLEDFDEDDEETMGPIFLATLRRKCTP